MKTYDERLRSIKKKANIRRVIGSSLKATLSLLLVFAVAWAAIKLPAANGSNANMEVPALTSPNIPGVTTTAPIGNSVPDVPPTDVVDPMDPSPTTPDMGTIEFRSVSIKTTQPSAIDEYPSVHLIRNKEMLKGF